MIIFIIQVSNVNFHSDSVYISNIFYFCFDMFSLDFLIMEIFVN